jgi:hypothetical protein
VNRVVTKQRIVAVVLSGVVATLMASTGWGRGSGPDGGIAVSDASARVVKKPAEKRTEKPAEIDSVEYLTEGGPDLAIDLSERVTRLRVDLVTGAASLSSYQPTRDDVSEPMGTFRAPVTPALMARLRGALAKADLGHIVRTEGGNLGGLGSSFIRIRITRGGLSQEFGYASLDIDAMQQLGPLFSVLDNAALFLLAHPYQAIRLDLQRQPGPELTFAITIKNVGTETVAIADLAALQREWSEIPEHGIGVRVAHRAPPRLRETEPPLVWSRVEVAAEIGSATRPMVLAPGQVQSFQSEICRDLPTHGPKAGTLMAQAFFWFYSGATTLEGRYKVRGFATSKMLELHP